MEETETEQDAMEETETERAEFELPYHLPLTVPIQQGQETITELVFKRRAVLDDVRDIRLSELDLGENLTKLAARLTSVPPSVAKRIDMTDVTALSQVVKSFFRDGRKTGKAAAD